MTEYLKDRIYTFIILGYDFKVLKDILTSLGARDKEVDKYYDMYIEEHRNINVNKSVINVLAIDSSEVLAYLPERVFKILQFRKRICFETLLTELNCSSNELSAILRTFEEQKIVELRDGLFKTEILLNGGCLK